MDNNTLMVLKIFGIITVIHFIFFMLVMVPNKTWYFFG